MCFFLSGCSQDFFSLSLVLRSLIMMCLGMGFFGFIPVWGLLGFLNLQVCVFHQVLEVFSHSYFSYYFSNPLSFATLSGTIMIQMLDLLLLSHGPKMTLFFFFTLLSFCSSDSVNPTHLPSSTLILSSVISLLLRPSAGFYFCFISILFPYFSGLWFPFDSSI